MLTRGCSCADPGRGLLVHRLNLSPIDAVEQELGKALMVTLAASRASSTWEQYVPRFEKFMEWCAARSPPRSALPASEITVALYLQSVLQTSNTFSVIKGTSAAISTLHEVNGYESPTEGKLCGQIRSAGERILGGRLVNQKEPLEWDVLHSYCIAACASGDFMRMLVAATALLAFSAFLRYSDVVSVYADEVKVFDTHAEIFLEKRKADQLRLGSIIVVARAADVRACPVRMLVWAISVTGSMGRHVPVFRRVDGRVVQWHPERARETYHRSEAMPYDQCSRYVLRFLAQHAKRSEADFRKEFGTQSLRSGGATAVAAAGVDSRMFQRHGGWRSTGCMNLYIKDSLEARLAVTRALPYAKGAAECE